MQNLLASTITGVSATTCFLSNLVVTNHIVKRETLLRLAESKVLSVERSQFPRAPTQNKPERSFALPGLGRCFVISKLFDVFFGCRHSRYSFPVTLRAAAGRPQAGALTGTYVACLDCGKEFAYDWDEMTVIASKSQSKHYAQSIVTKQVA